MNSKPHSGKTAVVYDRDITGLGGGDREALAFAKMLTSYGFSTQVVTNVLPIPSEERIATAFGDEFEGVAIKHVEISEMAEFFKVHQPDLFFNQSSPQAWTPRLPFLNGKLNVTTSCEKKFNVEGCQVNWLGKDLRI